MRNHNYFNLRVALLSLSLIASASLAAAQLQAEDKLDLSGRWSGTWRSEVSDHNGPLKAKFQILSNSKVQARFNGRFFKLIPFHFNVTLDIVEDKDGVVTLKGKEDLGRTLGIYTYNATFSNGKFVANYSTDKDKGVFEVTR
ncbi:MAG: hypothetical protein HOB73_12560 [Planctomycetaceae bacterium]|jgi:hypothetical protein|nr:hypothetical protein [Planctomycetaceae bacterium]